MGLAMRICKVLSLVQVDPKSSRRTTSIHVHSTKKVHRVSAHAAQCGNRGALVDRGANGGIIGNDAHVLYTHPGQEVNVTGIDNHQIDSLKVVDTSAKIFTQRGEAIGIFRQYAYHGKGRTIHSSGQIEWYTGNIVHDQSLKVGGAQHVRTLDGYILSIDIDNGLPYISQVPPHTRSSMNFHTSYSLPLRNGIQLFLTTSCPPNQTGLTSSRTTLKTDNYVLPLSMLTGTTYTDILTRNHILVTQRFSTRRSYLFLVFRPTTTMVTTPQ